MFVPVMGRAGSAVFALLICGIAASPSAAGPRLSSIRARGHVTCGVDARVAGFAERDAQGRYRGLDVDICRALSAAIFGVPDKVTFVQASSVAEFRRNAAIDVVSRRLTWELRREAPLGLLFGPITFYDGQGFLVAKRVGAATVDRLSGVAMCVAGGTPFEFNVGVYFGAHKLELNKVVLESPDKFDDIAGALAGNRCAAYTADVSELGAIRARMQRPGDWDILPDRISQEPLAQLVRADDPAVLRHPAVDRVRAYRSGTARRYGRERGRDEEARQRRGSAPARRRAGERQGARPARDVGVQRHQGAGELW